MKTKKRYNKKRKTIRRKIIRGGLLTEQQQKTITIEEQLKVKDKYCKDKANDPNYKRYAYYRSLGNATDDDYSVVDRSFSYEKYCRNRLSVEDHERLNAEGIRNAQTRIDKINKGHEKDNQELYVLPLQRKNEEIRKKIDELKTKYNKTAQRSQDDIKKRPEFIKFFNEILCPDVQHLAGGERYDELIGLRNKMLEILEQIQKKQPQTNGRKITDPIRHIAIKNCYSDEDFS